MQIKMAISCVWENRSNLFLSCRVIFSPRRLQKRGGWNSLDRGSPRERQANNSRQLSVLTEQWVRLLNPAVIYAYRGAVCRFPICAFTRRLCTGDWREGGDACAQIISDAAAWKNSDERNPYSSPDGAPLAYPQGYEKHRPILNDWLNKFLLKSNGERYRLPLIPVPLCPRKRAWTTFESN